MRSIKLVGLAAALLPLLVGGCKKKKSPNDPLEEMDLATVCAGVAEPRAKAYAKDGPNGHGIVVFERGGEDKEMTAPTPKLLSEFAPEKPQDVELVACAVRTAQTKVETCDYSDDHHLEIFDATYEISIREARTAAVLETKTVSMAAPRCWDFTRFKEKTEKAYPRVEFAAADMVVGIVQPREGGAPVAVSSFRVDTVTDSSLDKVCHGFPEKRAAAYEKVPGKISPAAAASRESDRAAFGSGIGPSFRGWDTKEGKDYQLVVCITEKSRTKSLECKFDEKYIIHSADYYGATYEVTVREAKTAKVVATTTVTEEGDKKCPGMYPAIKNDIHHVDDIPLGGPATLAFVKPFIAP